MVLSLTKQEVGPHYWSVLFSTANKYPDYPTRDEKIKMQNWLKTTISNFPCENCVKHSFEFIRYNPINVDNREGLIKWICSLKNNANEDEHKPTIDCDQFFKDNFSNPLECTSCSLINKPETTILKQSNNNLSNVPKEEVEFDYMHNSFFSSGFPSIKSNFAVNPSSDMSGSVDSIDPNAGMGNNLTQTFPSLAYFDGFKGPQQQGGQPIMMVQTPNGLVPYNQNQQGQQQPEELDGILKPLDSLYNGPASFLGTKPSDINLAYTPEFVANLYSLINQIFLTNFGSLLSISSASVLLFAVSVLAKNSLSYYDRLFLQNTIASIFFHGINYMNPRTKDEIIPMAQQFFEGLMSMDVEKMKKSLLYDGKNSGGGTKDSKNKSGISDSMLQLALMDENLDPALKQKLILAARGGKHIDMEKMKEPRNGVLSLGTDMSNSFASSSIRDMQNSSMTNFDSGIGGPRAPGGSGGSGILNKSALESMFNARAKYNSSSPTMRDYNMQKRFASPSVIDSSGLDSSYDYILDNALLG